MKWLTITLAVAIIIAAHFLGYFAGVDAGRADVGKVANTEYDTSQGAWSGPTMTGEEYEKASLDYRAMEIKSIELGIKKRIKRLNSLEASCANEWANRSDASLMIMVSLDLLLWDLERLAKYTDRDLEAVADEYGVVLPLSLIEK